MKKLLGVILSCAAMGCATNTVKQTDTSYEITETGESKKIREIATTTKGRTFFDSNSKLADFKATQSDKTQSTSIGSLSNSSSGTNVVNSLQSLENIMRMITVAP